MDDLQPVLALDRELVQATREIKLLSTIGWPMQTQDEFLAGWQRHQPVLPQVTYPAVQQGALKANLANISEAATRCDHPLAGFVASTAQSYYSAACMLEQLGQPAMGQHSVQLYGKPGDGLSGGKGKTSLDAARYFLQVATEYVNTSDALDVELCLPAQAIKQDIEAGLNAVFDRGQVSVVVDKKLASKAAAGATRIRLRDATCFSEYDAAQLLHHEAFVHSLTALNGRAQPNLTTLSLGAPRTTGAQEGLATFAELVTGSMDMARLERIAMRIIAIDMALNGADFIEVFKYFIDTGQPETESYQSTMRVFRGAPVTGGYAFTKDAVYLRGLLEVHTFFRWALKNQRLGLCKHFFAGRLTLDDVMRFEPFFTDGTIAEPAYLPPWMSRTTGLTSYLAISVFANAIDLDDPYPAV